jgi:tRNA A-37 threonylcarbamoyl transferase component Bud32
MALAPGASLGPYEVLGRLGRGGMGEVYSARDKRLERSVAIKVLPAELVDDARSRERLIREARAAASLSHPGICTLFEVGEYDGQTLIAMEQIPGKTLAELLLPGGMPTESVLRYGLQVASALAYAHDHGIVHRDLKCNNILVTPDGLAKVVDFGLAKRLEQEDLQDLTRSTESLTTDSAIAGTLAYMAPEILAGRSADPKSDIWSLGVVLHTMLSGSMPFSGSTPFELAAAILREPAKPVPSTVLPGLRVIVRRCLAKDATTRYQRASEVAAALESAHEDAAGFGVPVTTAPRRYGTGSIRDESSSTVDGIGHGESAVIGGAATDSAEVQVLNRIAGALGPVVTGARIIAAVSIATVLFGLLGVITGVTFDLAMHVPVDTSAVGYLILGVRAVIPIIGLMIAVAVMLAVLYLALRVAVWLAARLRGKEKAGTALERTWGAVGKRLDALEDPALVSWIAALSVVGLLAVGAASWPQLKTIEQLVELPATAHVDTTPLSAEANWRHFLVTSVTAATVLILGAVWLLGLSVMKRTGRSGAVAVVYRAAGVVAVFAVLALAVVPWRVVWANESEQVLFGGQKAFIVAESGARLFLFAPDFEERYLEVRSDDRRLERSSRAQRVNIFDTSD